MPITHFIIITYHFLFYKNKVLLYELNVYSVLYTAVSVNLTHTLSPCHKINLSISGLFSIMNDTRGFEHEI